MTKTATVTPVDATPSSIITDDMFASDAVVEKEVTLPDGKKHTLYFKELNAIEFKQHIAAEQSKDAKVREQSAARLIAKSVVEPDGRRALTAQQAGRLKPAVSAAMFLAIMEVNGVLGKRAEPVAVVPETEGGDDDGGDQEDELGN